MNESGVMTLLVLGASRYQLEVITKAKDLGYRVVTLDNVPSNPGHALADATFNVDTTDLEAALAVAKQVNANGVVSPCTDVAVTTAAHIATELGLPGAIPVASARVLTSKILFREFLADAQLPCPRFATIDSPSTLIGLAMDGNGGGAFVIKPDRSSGSKGIFIVRDEKELRQRLPATLAFSPVRRAIVEEMIEGHQGTCEGVIANGKIELAVVTDRLTAHPPFVVTTGHLVPTRLRQEHQVKIIGVIEHVLSARMQINNALFDCDFVFEEKTGTPYLLELTPRLGGNSLTRLVREALRVDLAEIAVRLALGEQDGAHALPHSVIAPTAQLILGTERSGNLTFNTSELARLKTLPWVRDVSLDYPAGHSVEAFINGRTRAGEATITAATREELDMHIQMLHQSLALDALATVT